MSCLSLSGPPLGPPVPVSTPIWSIGLPFYTAMILINRSINQLISHFLFHNKGLQGLKTNTLYITNNCTIQYIGRLGSAWSFLLLVHGSQHALQVIKPRLQLSKRDADGCSKSGPKVAQKYSMEKTRLQSSKRDSDGYSKSGPKVVQKYSME